MHIPLSIYQFFKVYFTGIVGTNHPIEKQTVKGVHVKGPCLSPHLSHLQDPNLKSDTGGHRALLGPSFSASTSPGLLLTTPILVAVVPAVIVSVTLPLGGDAGTLAEGTHCTREVAPTTGTLQVASKAWTERRGSRRPQLLSSQRL